MDHRILAGLPATNALTLGEHLDLHGPAPLLTRGDGNALIAEVAAAGLCGRGGAGFPTATKMGAVAGRRRAIVVANGAEGEPMSGKDRVLLTMTPHLVLDGAVIAAQAVGARDCVIAAPAATHAALRTAIRERLRAGRQPVKIRVEESAPGYVAGEETALIAHLEGRRPLPRMVPPRPAERGLRGRPTLVQNVETLANLALIARHGARWYRSTGSERRPGTTLVSMSGAVNVPGVYEVPGGTPLPSLLKIAGGGTEDIRALLVGGYFGAWVDGPGARLTLDDASLRAAGAATGAGVIVALGASDCPVAETANLAAWLAAESAGQCGPCIYGLAALADVLERIATGRTQAGDGKRISRWTEMVRGRGACRHPDGAAAMIASAGRVFSHELARHARGGGCRACRRPRVLRTPGAGSRMAA
jgi:NADH:ubiquinone oxidoreductase subunit F (NADH-binding)